MQNQKARVAKQTRATVERNGKAKRAPQPAQRQGSRTKETSDPQAPILSPCSLFGPDGKERPGWELRVGGVLFGRADSQESLLEYYARIHEPMPTGHWRERSWQPQRRVVRRPRQGDTNQEEMYGEDEIELENNVVEAWD